MFYFGTHEVGKQKKSTLLPFAPYRDKFALYRGACPCVLLEGVLEAEDNPNAKPDDTLANLKSDAQVGLDLVVISLSSLWRHHLQMWMVLGKEGQEDFRKRFPERAEKALIHVEQYTKGNDNLVLAALEFNKYMFSKKVLDCNQTI